MINIFIIITKAMSQLCGFNSIFRFQSNLNQVLFANATTLRNNETTKQNPTINFVQTIKNIEY